MALRLLKLVTGILLIPAGVAATRVFQSQIFPLLRTRWYFLSGIGTYLVLLAIFQQPIRTYVFGHELTHAFWVWLFGGRVKGFKAAASGGQVRATKSNFLIYLAPYFFPLYSFLAMALFLFLGLFFSGIGVSRGFSFILGFTWTFHITFTIYVLLQGQPDVRENGRVFSLALIYLANVVVLSCLLVFISPRVSYGNYFIDLWSQVRLIYLCLWREGPDFCRDRFNWLRQEMLSLTEA